MVEKDGEDIEMLSDDWKRTGHAIQTCDFFVGKVFLENVLIDFRVIIGIIILKVAIPLDVVSIYKSWGRMRDGKRSCLIIVDNRQKNLPDLIFQEYL